MVTATLAASSSGRWDNLKILVANRSVRDRCKQKALPILEATSPHKPYAVDWINERLTAG